MSRGITVYVEGGGSGGKTRKSFRMGMETFLKSAVDPEEKKRGRLRVIPCGGRRETYDAFVDAMDNDSEWYNILLVDAEDVVADMKFPWKHLRNRKGDSWEQPNGASDAQCQMMVICMEAWFLADPDTLFKYFGSRGKLPPAQQAESAGKDKIELLLKNIAKDTPKKEYKKIRDGAELLKKIDPNVVRAHCKWCDRLFNTLENLLVG